MNSGVMIVIEKKKKKSYRISKKKKTVCSIKLVGVSKSEQWWQPVSWFYSLLRKKKKNVKSYWPTGQNLCK